MRSAAASEQDRDRASRTAAARVADLFERHGRMVYGICRAMLRDVHDAEDATQQVFLSAHRALLGSAAVRDPGAWLAAIARNECRGRISAGMRMPLQLPEDVLADVPEGGDDVERRLQAGELRDALAELPERQREAVVLRYVCGLRYGEVAKALGLSRPATEALLFRARRTMRVRLRHAVGTVLAVPLSVREELALALPGFEGHASSGAAAVGITGGLLAKLAAAPAASKIATATVAVATVGAVGSVDSERAGRSAQPEARVLERASEDSARESSGEAGRRGRGSGEDDRASDEDRSGDDPSRSGRGGGGDSGDDDGERRAGSGERDDASGRSGRDDAERDDSSGPSSRSGGGERSGSSESSSSSGSSGPGSGDVTDDDRSGSGEPDDDDS